MSSLQQDLKASKQEVVWLRQERDEYLHALAALVDQQGGTVLLYDSFRDRLRPGTWRLDVVKDIENRGHRLTVVPE